MKITIEINKTTDFAMISLKKGNNYTQYACGCFGWKCLKNIKGKKSVVKEEGFNLDIK
jgi:hypothetical protein